ncbi:MAG: hypothetical protein MR016_08310 [Agathobacter sp.]|nr:hypothetical protein [Agathobacter sp.]
MESKGYIERKTVGNDRRSLHVYLTETGKKYADRLNCEFARIESEALKGFHEAEARQLQDLLTRVYENMIDIQKEERIDK